MCDRKQENDWRAKKRYDSGEEDQNLRKNGGLKDTKEETAEVKEVEEANERSNGRSLQSMKEEGEKKNDRIELMKRGMNEGRNDSECG